MKLIPCIDNTLQERFWSYVDKTSDCWLWTGHKLDSGYCQFRVGPKRYRVHRLAYFLHYGVQPSGIIMHTCDVRHCCNPKHLVDGTPAQNSADMVRKGRSAKLSGEDHSQSKLTSKDVRKILTMDGVYSVIGDQFGVSPSMVCAIKKRRHWKTL